MGAGGVGSRTPWWLPLAAGAARLLILGLGRTWRIRRLGIEERARALERGERCIFALWHARMLPLVYAHRGQGVAVLISQHRDGELIARVVERLGFATARGSSTRGGEEGVREMIRWAEQGRRLAVTPDGPRGPAEEVKPGLVYLASRIGWAVIPVASSARRTWVLRSWDRFRIPWPFARVVVAYGDPIHVPPDLSERDALYARGKIEDALRGLTDEVAVEAGERR